LLRLRRAANRGPDKSRNLLLGVTTALFLSFPGAAEAVIVTLDFSGNICGGGTSCGTSEAIDQSYGDSAGLDVLYDNNIADAFARGTTDARLFWWNTNYSDLLNVAYGQSGTATAEIYLDPAPGFEVELLSLDLGAWSCSARNSPLTVNSGGDPPFTTGPINVVGNGTCLPNSHDHYDFGGVGFTSDTFIQILWGPDAFNVGIDNVVFDVRQLTVPEPATLALLGAGLLGLSVLRRRRARKR
jgi:hypothetical protein